LENVERSHFVVLTGHLDERPLPDLIRTLRVQRKSGRLQIEYPDAPGAFFFEEGQLVDAQLGSLRGVEAIHAALSLRGAAFNFNPLVRPPERSIDRQGQKFLQDLIEVPRRESFGEIRTTGRASAAAAPALQPATSALPPAPQSALVRLEPDAAAELTAPLEARLTAVEFAIADASRRFTRERLIYMVVIAFLVGLTVVTALQALLDVRRRANAPATTAQAARQEANGAADNAQRATNTTANATDATNATAAQTNAQGNQDRNGGQNQPARQEQNQLADRAQSAGATTEAARESSRQTQIAARRSERAARQSQSGAGVVAAQRDERRTDAASSAASGGYVVNVLMEVKDGRVTEARVLNPRPGAEAYEALALRMARQRRYPDTFTGGDTWKIRVKQ
jgi:hypothetical protein